MIIFILMLIIGYLLGSIPFSYLAVSWIKGTDIRKQGTKNVGASNALQVAGKKAGLIALLGDIGKGLLAVFLAQHFANFAKWQVALVGFSAIVGHNWSFFLNFKGGRGLATSIGVLTFLFPLECAIIGIGALVLFIVVKDIIFVMSILSLCLPVLAWLFNEPFSATMAIILIIAFDQIRGFSSTKKAIKKVIEGFKKN